MQQTNVEGLTFAESRIASWTGTDAGPRLLSELQPLLAPYGVGTESLSNAFKEALLETGKNYIASSLERQRWIIIGLILWKVFARDSALWINSQTEAGNGVPLGVLIAAYSMWRNAMNLASKHGVDAAAAAGLLAQATHATADQMSGNGHSDGGEIRDIRKYVFASYMYAIFNLARKQGASRTDYIDMNDWIANRELSDHGASLEVVESGILCKELLEAMPPKGRSVAVARYILGYSWPETAEAMDTSVNAAQKALSSGITKALGMCMREIRKVGYRKAAEIERHLMKNKKDSRR